MKQFYIFIVLCISSICMGQEASPYKFTSVVDLYEFPTVVATGNLDAQLPLYTVNTKGFQLPLALIYDQMGNTNVFYKGSQFGDAWVLNSVGTIGRVCRERPNPIYFSGKSAVSCSNAGGLTKEFEYESYRHASLSNDEYFYGLNPSATSRQIPDIYTFSFLNLNGKFIIEKNGTQFTAKILESNDFATVQIEGLSAANNFANIWITDKNGYRYKFSSPSNINQNQSVSVSYTKSDIIAANGCNLSEGFNETPYPGVVLDGSIPGTSTVKAGTLISTGILNGTSTFWENLELTEIYDKENNLIVSYEYDTVFVAMLDTANQWVNGIGMFNSYHKLYLKKINVTGQGSIQFTNVISNNNKGNVVNSYTSGMEVRDLKQNSVKKYEFNYSVATSPPLAYIQKNYEQQGEMYFHKRLLTSVKELEISGQKSSATSMEYKTTSLSNSLTMVDRYGFIANSDYCRLHIHKTNYKADAYSLQKIKYPTGGSVGYKFGPHTFSKIQLLPGGFEEKNYDNHQYQELLSQVTGNTRRITVAPGDTLAVINKSLQALRLSKSSTDFNSPNLIATISRKNVGTWVYLDENYCKHHITRIVVPQDAGTTLYLGLANGAIFANDFKIYKYNHAPVRSNFVYAEGNRIEEIAYFKENPVGQDAAEKVVSFTYTDDNLSNASSGKVRNSFFADLQMRPFNVVYENVKTNIRGIGHQKTYYNLGTSFYWGTGLRTDIDSNLVYGLNGEKLSETAYGYSYQTVDVSGININSNDVKPFMTSNTATTRTYEGSSFMDSSASTNYDPIHRQVTGTTAEDNLGKTVKSEFDYAFKGSALVKTDARNFINGGLTDQVHTTYDGSGNPLKTEFKTPEMGTYEQTGMVNPQYYSGLLLGYTQIDGTFVTLVYGYNDTQLVAKLINLNPTVYYSATYSTLRNNIALQSNQSGPSYSEANLKTTLNVLRNTFPNALITTYTYKPMVGVASTTDENGKTTTYEYDTFNRLSAVKDYLGNIINEYQYNFTN